MPDRSYAEGINTQRIALAANLTTMGVSSVGTESLTDLVAKVLTVSDDADALAAEIVSGKTAYVDGAKVTGTMPDKEGDNACSSSSVDGTTLKLVAPTGYYDGTDTVTITDADFTAANIKSGVNVLGITGTYTNPKNIFYGGWGIDNAYRLNLASLNNEESAYALPSAGICACTDSTHVYVGNDNTHAYVYKLLKSDMSYVSKSEDYGAIKIYDVRVDSTHVYACGSMSGVRKILKSDMSAVATYDSGTYTEILMYGDHIYCCKAGGVIHKVLKSDLSKVAEYSSYGGDVRAICTDGTYLYVGGSTTNKMFKIQMSDMTKIAETASLGGAYYVAATDGTYLWAGGQGDGKIHKFNCSDMAQIALSPSYGTEFYGLAHVDDVIIAAGHLNGIKIYLASDLTIARTHAINHFTGNGVLFIHADQDTMNGH